MIELQHLSKTFSLKGRTVDAVRDVSLTIEDGDIYGVIGYSGAGKSTLVRCINLLETPDSGRLRVNDSGLITVENGRIYHGEGKAPMKDRQLNAMRRSIGMIFQHFNLLDRSTVFENVAYPLKYSGLSKAEIRERVMEMLQLVDLTEKRDAYPSQLSGGQKQRVAIARALANHPKVLLSDEATSALDPDATESILTLLRSLNERLGLTIVMITHEMAVIKSICRHVAVMEEGRVVEEGSVYDIFAHPKQNITRHFVASASALNKVEKLIQDDSPLVHTDPGALLVKLLFSRNSVGDSVISAISRDFNVSINIVLASVEVLEGAPLGGMVAIIKGDEKNVQAAIDWLNAHQVEVEVLRRG